MDQATAGAVGAVRAALVEAARRADREGEAARRAPGRICAEEAAALGLAVEVGGEVVRQIVVTLVLEGAIPPNRARSADLALPAWAERQPPGAVAEAMRRTVARLDQERGGPTRLDARRARELARALAARWSLARAEAARAACLDRGSGARQADVVAILAALQDRYADPASERAWLAERRADFGGRSAMGLILHGTEEEVGRVRSAAAVRRQR